jgi:sarcosine oxidase subunit gamma
LILKENASVSNYNLTAKTPLDGAEVTFEGATIKEITGRAIVSVAPHSQNEDALNKALLSNWDLSIPTISTMTSSTINNANLLGLQSDQLFLLFDCPGANASAQVSSKLGEHAYLTDQSDSWAMLAVSGPNIRRAFERICTIDLDDSAFPIGAVARTSMEHFSTILIRSKSDDYEILSPISSSASFLAMLKRALSH